MRPREASDGSELLQRVDNFLVVSRDLHSRPYSRDLAVGIDQERRPLDSQRFLAVHILLTPRPVLLGHLVIRVSQERKIELVLVAELHVAFGRIWADPEDLGTELHDFWLAIAKRTRFAGASGGVIFGVEIQYDRLSLERAERRTFVPSSAVKLKAGAAVPTSTQSAMAILLSKDHSANHPCDSTCATIVHAAGLASVGRPTPRVAGAGSVRRFGKKWVPRAGGMLRMEELFRIPHGFFPRRLSDYLDSKK